MPPWYQIGYVGSRGQLVHLDPGPRAQARPSTERERAPVGVPALLRLAIGDQAEIFAALITALRARAQLDLAVAEAADALVHAAEHLAANLAAQLELADTQQDVAAALDEELREQRGKVRHLQGDEKMNHLK